MRPSPEVAYQQVAAEAPEASGRDGHPPGRVERAVRGHARDEGARRVENAHESQTGTLDLVLAVLVLLGVGDEDAAAEVLDPEGRVALGKSRVHERARHRARH